MVRGREEAMNVLVGLLLVSLMLAGLLALRRAQMVRRLITYKRDKRYDTYFGLQRRIDYIDAAILFLHLVSLVTAVGAMSYAWLR